LIREEKEKANQNSYGRETMNKDQTKEDIMKNIGAPTRANTEMQL
jgi:hypothetical protein